MKPSRWAIILLLALYAVFAGSLIYAAGELPDRVATHFDFRGNPDGWMSKQADLLLMGVLGVGLPLFMMGMCYATRFLPARLVNIPNREYWLAPERRRQTSAYVAAQSIWLACVMLAFMTVVHLLVVFANQQSSPRLSTPLILGISTGFLVATGFWAWGLVDHFRRPSMPIRAGGFGPTVLLLLAVLIPSLCLLWFMNQAVKSERLTAQQRLMEAYRGQLAAAQERLENRLEENLKVLAQATNGAAAAFALTVRSNFADAVICFDAAGQPVYPASAPTFLLNRQSAELLEMRARESSDPAAAAKQFLRIATEATNETVVAQALQARIRCLLRAGQKDAATDALKQHLAANKFGNSRDPQNRLIAGDQEFLALELLQGEERNNALQSLKMRVVDYDNVFMPSSQRRFLMHELERLFPAQFEFPTLAAEDLAANFLEQTPARAGEPESLRASPMPGLWQMGAAEGKMLLLFRADTLPAKLASWLPSKSFPDDVSLVFIPPGKPTDQLLLPTQAGAALPGWRMALAIKDNRLFENAAGSRISSLVWIGMLVLGSVVVLALLVLRLFRRQIALTQLRNDMVANVTHELKTPLSSMRLLVETLLGSAKFDPQTTREYLELIARENLRLSRLIDNFLTFSRIERNKYTFDFRQVPVAQIIDAAAQSVRERFNAPGCKFQVQTPSDLPAVLADSDAMVTAVVNLLDNAYKYSGDEKQITLTAAASNSHVELSVKDNGIGLSPRDTKRIFKRFYQVDQRLSRSGGGCGLGLSIVKFIIAAHHGSVRVESEPGRGSIFTIDLPIATTEHSSEEKL